MRGLRLTTVPALAICAGAALAHPHFNKTVTAKLPSGAEVTITYLTVPGNEMRAGEVATGAFVSPGRSTVKLAAEVKAGATTIPAGDYTIGVVKNGKDDWTLALHPGALARGAAPDMAKVVKLESLYSGSAGTAEHMLIDVTPGHGKFEGRAVMTLHFGSMFLAGALS